MSCLCVKCSSRINSKQGRKEAKAITEFDKNIKVSARSRRLLAVAGQIKSSSVVVVRHVFARKRCNKRERTLRISMYYVDEEPGIVLGS